MPFEDETTSAALEPRDERVHDDNYVYNEIKRILSDNRDTFGNQVADRLNLLDIATHYNFSPERSRLFRNGSREFPQYNSVSQFSDNADHWLLQPDAGDTMHIESAESGTYVVNWELQGSWALQLNQSLTSGDKLRWGPAGPNNGWLLEQDGSKHTDTQADIIELSGGTETTQLENVDLPKPTTEWWRWECQFSWYSVGNQEWYCSYTEDGESFYEKFAQTSNDANRGPETGNLNLWYEIQADSGTSGLELEVGSMGMIVRGNPTSLNRDKQQFKQVTVTGSTNTWEPIYAIRIDPDNDQVNCQFRELDILDYAANDDLELVVSGFDPSKTDISESDWSVPDYHHSFNSVMQETTNVSQVADNSGTQKDLTSSDKFGGYTIASGADIDGGNTEGSAADQNQGRVEKKAVLQSDHYVFLVRTGTVDNVLSFTWDVDQNW